MSENRFDPYHTWLGMPAEPPPNYYRLLGIPLFESDPEVIQNACDQRMAHLKAVAAGRHAALSERLLNNLSKATACLLNAARKHTYDAALRTTMEQAPSRKTRAADRPRTVVSGRENVRAPASGDEAPQTFTPNRVSVSPSVSARISRGRHARRKQRRLLIPAIQVFITGVLGLAAGCFILWLVYPTHPILQHIRQVARRAPTTPAVPPGSRPSPSIREREGPQGQGQARGQGQGQGQAREQGQGQGQAREPTEFDAAPEQVISRRKADSPARMPSGAGQQPSGQLEAEPSGAEQREPALSELGDGAPRLSPSRAADTNGELESEHQTVVKVVSLDLSRSCFYETLPEVTDVRQAEVRLEQVMGMGEPHLLKPRDGVVRVGQPVDAVFSQAAEVRIKVRVELETKAAATCLKISPQIETGSGQATPFTQRRAAAECSKGRKMAAGLQQQLDAARARSAFIQNWLATPGPKLLGLRGRMRAEFGALQTRIPVLKQQLHEAQRHAGLWQQLAEFAEELQRKARLRIVVCTTAGDTESQP